MTDLETPLAGSHYISESIDLLIAKKNWKDGISQEKLQMFSPEEIKRQQLIWELFTTEVSYIEDLNMVIEVVIRFKLSCHFT